MIINIHFGFLNRSLLSCSTLFADTPYNKWVALITYLHAVRSMFLRCSLQNHKMTTGGTESLMMACKAYRDFGREIKGIDRPNMVIPRTAHSGFDKAAQYLGIHVNYVDVDVDTTKVNVAQMKRKINKNTIMVSVYRATIIAARISITPDVCSVIRIVRSSATFPLFPSLLSRFHLSQLVGSAPNFPYGTMDDIGAIAALGVAYDVPVHVDACLGGFLVPFMKRAGYPLPPFDFRVNGVTSISADPHKVNWSLLFLYLESSKLFL